MGRDFRIFYSGLEEGRRALVKDPFAVFSTEWFARKLNFQIVISVRHPLAFVSSLKRLNWTFDFHDLLDQPLLMHEHLEAYRSQMESTKSKNVIEQGALLWKMIYETVHSMLSLHPDFILIRHEDLSRDPISGFHNLYEALGLDYTHHIEKSILASTSSENPMELSRKKVHDVRLDSRANMSNWKKRLADDEINRVREMTGDVAQLFYTDPEWA